MSLYNMLLGVNPMVPPILGLLNTEATELGRFRDAYFTKEDDEVVIAIFARNGGGNRACWKEEAKENTEDCNCPGCTQQLFVPKMPGYIRDFDDDFDSTYCTTVFRLPDETEAIFAEIDLDLEDLVAEQTPIEKFKDLIEKLETPDYNGPEVQNAREVGRQIFGGLEESLEDGGIREISNEDGGVVIVGGSAIVDDEEPA